MRVRLSSMPDPNETASISLSSFGGGLNRRDYPGHLSSTESPDLVNLWYDGGILCPRPGTKQIFAPGTTEESSLPAGKQPYFYDRLWNGLAVFACGTGLGWFDPGSSPATAVFTADCLHAIADSSGSTALVPAGTEPGSFFAFGSYLYYKAAQLYLRLKLDTDTASGEPVITAERLLWCDENSTLQTSAAVYTPVIAISRTADGSASTAYQPENRLNPDKTVWFDIDDSSLDYYLPVHGCEILSVQLGDDTAVSFQVPDFSGQETEDEAALPAVTDRMGQVGSRFVTLRGEDLADDSTEYTCLHFDLPLYVDESARSSEDLSTAASQGGSYLQHVIYSSFNLPGVSAGDGNLIAASTGEAADAVLAKYAQQVQIAVYLASRDYGEDLLSGRYLISLNDDYLTVLLETVGGMRVTAYDSATTEFSAVGWIRESVLLADADADLAVIPSSLTANQLRVTYRKKNDAAMASIAECGIARSFGGSSGVCAVLAGCSAQPNAIFWSGNGSDGIDPTYFPMDQYNLCGSYADPVTGLGVQQSALIILQEHSVGKAGYSISELTDASGIGRKFIDLSYQAINARFGCDRPRTIVLCGNHLVWVNSRYGVLLLRSTSAAGENQISVLSGKVFPPAGSRRLLRYQGPGTDSGAESVFSDPSMAVCAAADRDRFYLFGEDESLLMLDFDGVTEDADSGCWTCHTGFGAAAGSALVTGDAQLWLGSSTGGITLMDRGLTGDNGTAFLCRYTSPTLVPGSPARVRRIRTVVLQVPCCGSTLSTAVFGNDPEWSAYSVTESLTLTAGEQRDPILLRPGLRTTASLALRLEAENLQLRSIRVLYTTLGPNR